MSNACVHLLNFVKHGGTTVKRGDR
jgi:hypothetical protein